MSWRILGLAVVAGLSACATSSEGPPPPPPPWQVDPAPPTSQTQLSQLDECLAACQAKYDRCGDDSAKERSDPGTTCYGDFSACSQKCEVTAQADPANRANQGITVGEGASVGTDNVVISLPGVTTVSKGR